MRAADALLLTLLAMAGSALCRPSRATCPEGYDLRTGIRRSGDFECWPHPVGDPEWDGTWRRPDRSTQPDGVIGGRIYCTGGAEPIVVNDRTDRTVGCQRQ